MPAPRPLLLYLVAPAFALCLAAGPVDFGKAEVARALAERGVNPKIFRIRAEITESRPETYLIQPGRVSGGDARGLMYGLLEAAEQIRERGRLSAARGAPATPIRGIRVFLHNQDLERDWYYSHEYWQDFLAMLARNRFNRLNLVFAHKTDYLAPPYPYWLALPEFPGVRVAGLTDAQRERNLEMLRYISETAAEHAVDFTLGVWEHNVQAGMKPGVEGLTRANIGPYSYSALKRILAECPKIRSVQMRTNSESGVPDEQQVEFYRDWVFRAVAEAGRRVTLDLRGWAMHPEMLEAAVHSGAPLRLSSKYWAEFLGRPYQPAETFPGYSYLNFLEKPRPYGFYWEVWALGSNRLLLWGNTEYVRRAVPTFTVSGTEGFEIDPPLAQKGFGNAPGKWGIFTEGQENRLFWKHEFERYWLFYLLWGRLSYDPKLPESVWLGECRRRFGAAAAEVLDAYRNASSILPELVAAFMPDPNMYVWPEVSYGGPMDAYRQVKPSDWRFIAAIPEAVRNRISGVASAKQTPAQTAERLDGFAARTEAAVERAKARLGDTHLEWRGSEPDFRVLAALARYHARKRTAAERLTWFLETGDTAALAEAKRQLQDGAAIWRKLAEFTDGLYPPNMAYGPEETGHWKDRLAGVQADLGFIDGVKRPEGGQAAQPAPAARAMKPSSRPTFGHLPPKSAAPDKPLALALSVWPLSSATVVRLHYRPLNQLAHFKTLEAPASRAHFTIPSEDVSARWDLLYYFEVLNKEGGGWFHPDPWTATPYFVVAVEAPPGGRAAE